MKMSGMSNQFKYNTMKKSHYIHIVLMDSVDRPYWAFLYCQKSAKVLE